MHLGIIGYGNIACTLLDLLSQDGAPRPARITVLVRPARRAEIAADLAARPEPGGTAEAVETADALVAARPDLVVECAGHGAARDHVPMVLRAGIDVVLVSVGALADPALEADLRAAARAGGARLVLPAGAVGGVDLLAALGAAGGALEVRYRGTKPPAAWAETPAAEALDLGALRAPEVIFSGNARQAAAEYPRNANVAATLALAGAGFEATRVELVADPAAAGNLHAFEVRAPAARFRVEIENMPSAGNVKTSIATVYSVLREIRNRLSEVAI